MPSYLSPGIYPREIDFSFYVKQISTSACGMVGVTEKGPINVPTLVTSWEQFQRVFGGYIEDGYLAYAARGFFDNGGNILYVTRVAHYEAGLLTAVSSSVTIHARPPLIDPAMKVVALSPGTWGDLLSVTIQDGTDNPTSEFDLTVNYKGQVVEVFRNLSVGDSDANHMEKVINGRSEWITVEDLLPGIATHESRPAVSIFTLDGGDDGLVGMADADYIGDSGLHTGIYSFEEIEELNLLCVPGVTTAPVIAAGIAYAEGRKDMFFIAETPISLDPMNAVDFRKGQGTYTHSAFASSYGALYYPWIEIYDPLSGRNKLVPPAGAVAGCIARSDQKTEVWYAPAGIDRGRVLNVLGLSYRTSRGERDVLYSAGVNVIARFPDSGVCIWGQKTLQSQSSALDRINVRRLMMHIETAISKSAGFVVFEPHNPQTWRALVRLITPFLQNIKSRGGFYDYRVQCDEETNTPAMIDQNTLVCRVFVQPTKTAEFVELNFILTPTGAKFDEVM